MTIQANQGFGVSIFGATSAGGGGSTSPGGSSGQLQYNASGSFAGMAGTSWDDTNRALTLTGATVTTSQPVLNLSQTWNAGAVTFTGLRFNATDTASASGSLLLDIGTGGGSYTSAFNVTKTGGFTFNDTATTTGTTPWRFLAPNLTAPGGATIFVGKDTNTGARLTYDALLSSAVVGVNISGTTAHVTLLAGGTGGFLYLRPGSSGATQLGAADAAAPVAQTLQVQSVVAGTTNTAGANWTLKGSAGTGTGAGGSIIFQVAPAGSSGTAQNAYSTALSLNSSQQIVVENAGSASAPAITWAGSLTTGIFRSSASILDFALNGTTTMRVATNGAYISRANSPFQVSATGNFSFSSNVAGTDAADVILARDAANTLALRNGTNAQTFNVYNTYTDASNYERGVARWSGNVLCIGSEAAGTGTARVVAVGSNPTGSPTANLVLSGNNILFYTTAGQPWQMSAAGHFLSSSDNTYDIGASGANRPRNVYVGTQIFAPSGSIGTVKCDFINNSTNSRTFWQLATSADSAQFGVGMTNPLMQFGGTTSSFPALKRSSASLICRLADDSANAAFEALSLKTGAPSGGTSGTWKLGVRVAATTVLDTTQYIEVDVGGTLYKLAVVTS